MDARITKTLAVLGVPGVALGFFYLMLKQFGFTFSTIAPLASAVVAILFLLIVGGITFYALYRWAPSRPPEMAKEGGFRAHDQTGGGVTTDRVTAKQTIELSSEMPGKNYDPKARPPAKHRGRQR